MKCILLFLIFSILLVSCASNKVEKLKLSARNPSSLTDGGRVISNGGDVLKCTVNGHDEYTVLDFFARDINNIYEYENKDYIEKILVYNFGIAGLEYESLLISFLERKNSKQNDLYYWKKSPSNLTEINDENLDFVIPKNCKKIQAIQRKSNEMYSDRIEFLYDDDVITKLPENQISWLILHEFLWSKYQKASEIRAVNQYFHSKDISDINENELLLKIKNMTVHSKVEIENVRKYQTILHDQQNNLKSYLYYSIELKKDKSFSYYVSSNRENNKIYVLQSNNLKILNNCTYDKQISSSNSSLISFFTCRNRANEYHYFLEDKESTYWDPVPPQAFGNLVYDSKHLISGSTPGRYSKKQIFSISEGNLKFKNTFIYFNVQQKKKWWLYKQIVSDIYGDSSLKIADLADDMKTTRIPSGVIANEDSILLEYLQKKQFICDTNSSICFEIDNTLIDRDPLHESLEGKKINNIDHFWSKNTQGLYLIKRDYLNGQDLYVDQGLGFYDTTKKQFCVAFVQESILSNNQTKNLNDNLDLLMPQYCENKNDEYTCVFDNVSKLGKKGSLLGTRLRKLNINFSKCTGSGVGKVDYRKLNFK